MAPTRSGWVAGLAVLILIVPTSATIAGPTAPLCLGMEATIWGKSGTIRGTNGADVIVGSPGPDLIAGRDGKDFICGKGGVDAITGGEGLDTINGGGGGDQLVGGPRHDTVSYDDAPDSVEVNLSAGKALTSSGVDELDSFASATGSDFDDVLTGDSGENNLDGGDGHDTLIGRGNRDGLTGWDGDDFISGGSGSDLLQGLEGDDTVSYRGAPGSVTVDLGNFSGGDASGAWGGDELFSIENVGGSLFDDVLTGNAEVNFMSGFGGFDIIKGLHESDLLDGGGGDDVLLGGPGLDTLAGGTHDDVGDTASYEDAFGPLTVNLDAETANPDGHGNSDLLLEIENVIGAYGANTLTGDSADNVLIGCDVEDTVNGLGGDDTLRGGLLDDTLNGGAGNDHIDGESGTDTINGGPASDTCFGENLSNCESGDA